MKKLLQLDAYMQRQILLYLTDDNVIKVLTEQRIGVVSTGWCANFKKYSGALVLAD